MNNDLELELFDDAADDGAAFAGRPWKVLVVDDNPDVHAATDYALKDVSIFGRPLKTISAHSVDEAIVRAEEHEDIAVSMIDVVMETDDAGMKLVKALRNKGFSDMRLVLRTGYPGYAPELAVVTDYEIDGYHTKDELTRTRLISLLTTSIRAYDSIRAMSRSREGLELIVRSARQLFRRGNLEMFAEGVLTHLGNVDAPLKGVLAGPADLLRLEIHGPQSECDKLKEALSPLGCVFYVTDWGFRNAYPKA